MEQTDDLRGMKAADAKEYIFHYITTLKLTEKNYGELQEELDKWEGRAGLARSRGAADLADEAEREAARAKARMDTLAGEIADLKAQIGTMRRQLPGLAARERSIDPDLLEQQMKIAIDAQLGTRSVSPNQISTGVDPGNGHSTPVTGGQSLDCPRVPPGEDDPEQRLGREIDGLNADAALAALKAQLSGGQPV